MRNVTTIKRSNLSVVFQLRKFIDSIGRELLTRMEYFRITLQGGKETKSEARVNEERSATRCVSQMALT
jgi:hypothetical protein